MVTIIYVFHENTGPRTKFKTLFKYQNQVL